MINIRAWGMAAITGVVAACGTGEPRAVNPGVDECGHCRMVVEDTRFAAQLITTRGQAHVFDAIECLANHVDGEAVPPDEIRSLWVADFGQPDEWVPAEEAVYVHSMNIRSPMGLGVAAHSSREAAEAHVAEVGGHTMSWDQVITAARQQGGHSTHRHGAMGRGTDGS